MKKVLAIGAHPDDIEWRISGTLIKLKNLGYHIQIVDLTRGEKASQGTPNQRKLEAYKAAGALGAKRTILNWGDRNIKVNATHRQLIKKIINQHKPDLIFSPFYQDKHPDHANTGKLLKPHNPVFYLPHSKVVPNYFVNITPVYDQRMEAVYIFKSQATQANVKKLRERLRKYGQKINCQYAESYFYQGRQRLPNIFIQKRKQ